MHPFSTPWIHYPLNPLKCIDSLYCKHAKLRHNCLIGHFQKYCVKWKLLPEPLTVFWCFQGVEKGCIGNKWVKEGWACFSCSKLSTFSTLRGRPSEVFYKKVFWNICKFHNKTHVSESYLDKIAECRPAVWLKKTSVQVFSCKFLQTFSEHIFNKTTLEMILQISKENNE